MLPKRATLETCTACRLNCRGCFLKNSGAAGVGIGHLTLANFVRFVEMNPFIKEINLTHAGEVFYNPELLEILSYAHSRGLVIDLWDTSFHDVHDKILKALVYCKVIHLKISLNGATPKSYSWYHRGGNFDQVIENIKKLTAYKEKYGSSYPQLWWQYIILEKNDSLEEIRLAKKMAVELGLTKLVFRKDFYGYVPKNKDLVEAETGLKYD